MKAIKNNILLYSTNSFLAYYINENFYGRHFVWCSPIFDTALLGKNHKFSQIPPSSNPNNIYRRLKEDVDRSDLHSNNILQNKSGLKKGAIKMLNAGAIDANDFARINSIIDNATIDKFRPVMYLIPKEIVINKIDVVDVDALANPLSVEYQICTLYNNEFEIIEF